MSRTALRPRLGVETLEQRAIPAIFSVMSYGSISFANGSVVAQGTEYDDVIRVHKYEPVLSQSNAFAGNWDDVTAFGDQIIVTITDAQGNVRSDWSGNPLLQSFNYNSVNLIEANCLGGNDRTSNATGKTMVHAGGEGNDSMFGGWDMDILNGGNGNDSLVGGDGNDQLYGMAGNDRMVGDGGNDYMQGGDQRDSMSGGGGHDTMFGEGDMDEMLGGYGDDTLSGGDDLDIILGEAGRDLLNGDGGNDIMSGGSENDLMYGDAGNDQLEGNGGNDGLFGGAGKEHLFGGSGIDSFLKWEGAGNTTTVHDRKSNESLTVFKNTTSVQTFNHQGVTLRYNPAVWGEDEIEQVDVGMDFLHQETGNTRLLRRSNGTNQAMLRFGDYIPYNDTDGKNDVKDAFANQEGPRFAGFNKGDGRIYLNHLTFDDAPVSVIASIVVHEFAHNWDTENGKYAEWKGLSGWVAGSNPGLGQSLSSDGKWVYNSDDPFARDYGKTNPLEDFATSFEAYFALKSGTLSYFDLVRLTPKLNFIGLFITRMSA